MVLKTTVRQVLAEKQSDEVWTIRPDQSVYEALREMARHNIGALLVLNDEHIVGIIGERDYARKVLLEGKSSHTTKVFEIMSSPVSVVEPEDSVDACLALMTEMRLRHLPVMDDGRLVGLISMGDVVKSVISDREFMIEQLGHYVWGSYSGWFDYFSPGQEKNLDEAV